MSKSDTNHDLKFLTPLLADLFIIDAVYAQANKVDVRMTFRFNPKQCKKLLDDRLKLAGYIYTTTESSDHILLSIDPRRKLRIPPLNIFLFVVTLLSVYITPVYFLASLPGLTFSGQVDRTLAALGRGDGIEFSIALISILLVHEMGHFIAGHRRGIITSWPYFIPAPNLIGTFGAIIKSKSPFWNRRDLIEVGAWGPVAGWVVALGWLVYGLSNSIMLPVSMTGAEPLIFSMDGESILIKMIVPILVGSAQSGEVYIFSEAAFAAWVGLLVTALNMLPMGQFDGGHVAYGLIGRRQEKLAWVVFGGLILLGFGSMIWWVFAAFGFISRLAHPPTLNDRLPPGRSALILGIVAIMIFVVSFTPAPFQ
jgi:hypothetical protein